MPKKLKKYQSEMDSTTSGNVSSLRQQIENELFEQMHKNWILKEKEVTNPENNKSIEQMLKDSRNQKKQVEMIYYKKGGSVKSKKKK